MTDEEWRKRLLRRNEKDYQLLIQQYGKLCWAVAASILSGPHASRMDIEELVSDVFFRFWKQPEKYDPERGSLKNYLALMTKSMALNALKKLRREAVLPLEEGWEKADVTMPEPDWQGLYTAIQQLEEPTREIMIRRFFYNEKPARIRQKMHLSSKEVDNRLYRGKKKLRSLLEDPVHWEGGLEYE